MISRSYYGDVKKVALIAEYNNIQNINQISIGQKIKIPELLLEKTQQKADLKEADLAGAEKIKTGPIKEADIKKQGLFSKSALMFVIMIFLVGVLVLLLFKLHGLKGPVDRVKIEEGGSFTMGKVDPGDTQIKRSRFGTGLLEKFKGRLGR